MTLFARVTAHGRRSLSILVPLMVVAPFFLQGPALAQVKDVRRVLIFYELGLSSPGVTLVDQGIRSALEKTPYQIELYREYLDTTLFPDPGSQQEFRQWYVHKYRDRRPDLIIAAGPSPLRFLVDSHEKFFSAIPIVFCGTSQDMADNPQLDSNFTGVWEKLEPAKTLGVALRLQPKTKHVFVIGGTNPFDRHLESMVKKDLAAYQSDLDIVDLVDLTMPQLLEKVKHLPEHTIVLLTDVAEDAGGTKFVGSTQSGPMLVNAANAPVFSLADVDFGHGEVGGDVTSFAKEGQIVGNMAQRILKGEKPQDIPVVTGVNVYMFDWRALQRWGLSKSLPLGSTIVFRDLSIWERAKWIFLSGLSIIILLVALAVYLQYSRKQIRLARDAQTQLSRLLIGGQEKERSRLATELHDDFSQKVALLALQMETVADTISTSPQEAEKQLHELMNATSEIGADLHTLSHRLHSSTLESLGLVPALSALCKEIRSQQGIEVDFRSDSVPRSVGEDTALCVFRIVQEGLRNVKKYSGVQKAEVELRRASDRLHLTVRDEGRGFDLTNLQHNEGLGLRSMKERAYLVGGQFQIHSAVGKGTTIEVCVPLQSTPS
jgi:signal transduction histidine kinase/ABC-type uncharacterized transport system substrate-binding protein